jgi:hypothetical protein
VNRITLKLVNSSSFKIVVPKKEYSVKTLRLSLPFSSRRFRAPVQAPDYATNITKDWSTPDGVEIWQVRALYQPCVKVLEGARPLRVVLLQDYEALARLVAAHGQTAKSAGTPDASTQISAGAP